VQTLRWSLEGRTQDCGAWRTTYAATAAAGTSPLENVLLGLSAHINFDLALGIYRTIVELGADRDEAMLRRFKHDHDAVNDLLRASIPEAFDHLILLHGCEAATMLFQHAYAAAEWAAMHVLESWREHVWHDAMALLRAPNPAARERIVHAMEVRSRRYARLLSIPGFALLPLTTARAGRRPSLHTCAVTETTHEPPRDVQPRAARPARLATTAVSSEGSIGLGRWEE
jgi:hypothetical protein